MYEVLRVDGPNLTTDKGGVCIVPFAYADGGKTKPVSLKDAQKMRALFIAAPQLLRALQDIIAALNANPNLFIMRCASTLMGRGR